MSGFPAQAAQSIILDNNKQQKLYSLYKILYDSGYSTSFYYGGESEFDNYKSYLFSHRCNKIIDVNFFPKGKQNSKWGVYDESVYEKNIHDLTQEKQPFFSTILSLTNHEPFELPRMGRFGNDSEPNKFRSTAFYADSCLSDYLKRASKEAWYKNTLFVIVADHGTPLPQNRDEIFQPQRFHIPILFLGDAIKPVYQGKSIQRIVSQTDIAKTILNQLKIHTKDFKWSRDMLDTTQKEFCFYSWHNAFGYKTPRQTIAFDNISKQIIFRADATIAYQQDSIIVKQGQAHMQMIYHEFVNY